MTKYQQVLQDVLHTIFAIGMTGVLLSGSLKPVLSQGVYTWLGVFFLGGIIFVYNMDSIFGFANPTVPTVPPIPPLASPAPDTSANT